MGMTEVSFVIPGRIAGKGRPRFNHKTRTTYTPPKTRNAESMVRQCAATAMGGRAPLEGLLSLDIAVVLIPPLSWSKKRRAEAIYVTGRPDADNIIKLIGDSLNGVVWIDDAQIARILFCRRFDGGPECARISVERLIGGLQTRGCAA